MIKGSIKVSRKALHHFSTVDTLQSFSSSTTAKNTKNFINSNNEHPTPTFPLSPPRRFDKDYFKFFLYTFFFFFFFFF
jgi:hypothetical protein